MTQDSRFDAAFVSYGWLVPCLLPLTEIGGRALFSILGGLYLVWGLAVLLRLRPALPISGWLPLLLVMAAMAPSMLASTESGDAAREWGKFVLHSLTFVLTLAALQQRPDNIDRLLRVLGWSALGLLALLYTMLPFQMSQAEFDPFQQLREDNLPWLAPFLLILLSGEKTSGTWIAWSLAALLAIAIYIGLSHGRAALVGLMVALWVYAWRVLGWRWSKLLLAPACVLAIAIALNPERFFRIDSSPGVAQQSAATQGEAGSVPSRWEWLDRLSSFRTRLWRNAVTNPPPHPWVGVGMGQVGHYPQVVETRITHAKHLHNFLLDAWYETGWLGSGALLVALLIYMRRGFLATGLAVSGRRRRQAGALLAGALALVAAASLSYSYTSRQFTVYLMVMLAGLQSLYMRSVPRPEGDDSRSR